MWHLGGLATFRINFSENYEGIFYFVSFLFWSWTEICRYFFSVKVLALTWFKDFCNIVWNRKIAFTKNVIRKIRCGLLWKCFISVLWLIFWAYTWNCYAFFKCGTRRGHHKIHEEQSVFSVLYPSCLWIKNEMDFDTLMKDDLLLLNHSRVSLPQLYLPSSSFSFDVAAFWSTVPAVSFSRGGSVDCIPGKDYLWWDSSKNEGRYYKIRCFLCKKKSSI